MEAILPPRGVDAWGAGTWGASRTSSGRKGKEGKHNHYALDFAVWPGSLILSPVAGTVTKLGYPYADDLYFRYVEITEGGENLRHRFFYVGPTVGLGDRVVQGQSIGFAQSLLKRYPDITPHIHYEIKDTDGKYRKPFKTDVIGV